MSNKLIFLFHGMGVHTKDTMKKDFLDPIEEYAKFYGVKLKDNWKKSFYLVEYDSYFNKILDDWRKDVQSLRDMAIPLSGSFPEEFKKLEKLDKQLTPENRGFFITHFGDVILYKFLRDVRSWIDTDTGTKIRDEITKFVESHNNDRSRVKIYFLGHSLGTAIAADILNYYYEKTTSPRFPYLDSLFMFANVSHLVRGNPLEPEDSVIYDTHAHPDDGTEFYRNYRHKFDYFTVDPLRFQPSWENSYPNSYLDLKLETLTLPVFLGRDINKFGDITDEIINEIKEKCKDLKSIGNIHSFKHYISNPDCFFDFVEKSNLSNSSNLDELKAKSYEKYKKISIDVTDMDDLKNLLETSVINQNKKLRDIFK